MSDESETHQDIELAEQGDVDAMDRLGFRHRELEDLEGAKEWFTRAAELDSRYAMWMLGQILKEQEDFVGAEAWLRRGVEAGDDDAMVSLGLLLDRDGDNREADYWYECAANLGNCDAMLLLGHAAKAGGDLIDAESWFRRGAEADDSNSMNSLARLLQNGGDLEEAETWFRRSIEAGGTMALDGLGYLLLVKGDLDGALDVYLSAADAGSSYAMAGIASLLQNRGDLIGAERWYRKSSDAGYVEANEYLDQLAKKIGADPWLDAISFDTFDLEMIVNDIGFRQWRGGAVNLGERFIDDEPDFGSLRLEELRSLIMIVQGMVESKTFSVGNLEGMEELQRCFPNQLPDQTSLLDVEVFAVSRARCIATTTRNRFQDVVVYTTTTMVLFEKCFWLLTLEIKENQLVGEREGAVIRYLLQNVKSLDEREPMFDPYDRKWDGLIPLKQDPLSQLRVIGLQLRNSISLSNLTDDLEPYKAKHRLLYSVLTRFPRLLKRYMQ